MNQSVIQKPTAEEIVQHYRACMDSVNIINGRKPDRWTDAEWEACLARNKDHLRHMLEKDFWTTEDLTPLRAASQ